MRSGSQSNQDVRAQQRKALVCYQLQGYDRRLRAQRQTPAGGQPWLKRSHMQSPCTSAWAPVTMPRFSMASAAHRSFQCAPPFCDLSKPPDGAFFLHGSRRYVCRGCTSHLRLVKERDTNQAAKPETEQTEPHQQTQPTQKGARFVPQVGCVSQWRRVKHGGTEGQ